MENITTTVLTSIQEHATPPSHSALDHSPARLLLERDLTFPTLGQALPALKALNACSCAIFMFVLCLAALGLQSGGTIIVVDDLARSALLLASLASGLAIVSGSACYVYTLLLGSGVDILAAPFRPSQLIYAMSCTWVSLAGLSLSVFMVRVAHATSPMTSTIFFVVAGCLSSMVLCFALLYHRMSRRRLPQQSPTQPAAVA
ncbi:hypothetical protein BOTBODRAFT_452871 [Botryobasidium botryosum FD-172 SS1]|uniref:Uncharacterized protein n=1 Tax=Botryobasidium botryosum (strain FD-172 SS1) TaxID=930990 RepID=A0A067MI48_BOTB1|nr:hypothetical protein BOTBODRAFT_452871 [Botryobasidium botryosum FD-172 SS1]